MTPSITADDRGAAILLELGRRGRHVYAGTVSRAEKHRRRAVEAARSRRTARAAR